MEIKLVGCVTTLETNSGTKIAIDIGKNLPSIKEEKREDLEIEGLTVKGDSKFDAVFVTHYHGDHIGLYSKVLDGIPIYIGKISKEIFKIVQERLFKAKIVSKRNLEIVEGFITYEIPQKIMIKDITVTPIEVDHSAFNSHMLLIEGDRKRILHTGDFRIHGPRGKAVIPALEKYVGKVDYLICEGTTLSRKDEKILTEFEVQRRAKEIFRENKYVFILCSSTNIDRIALFHKAAISDDKMFICDSYQCDILEYISKVSRSKLYKFNESKDTKVYRYGKNMLEKMKEYGFVMLIRDNFLSRDVMKNFKESCFIYSEWEGYLDKEFKEYKRLQEFVPDNCIHLHTSGHAYFDAIKEVCEVVEPKVIIPIHSEEPKEFEKMNLKNSKIEYLKNGEVYEL